MPVSLVVIKELVGAILQKKLQAEFLQNCGFHPAHGGILPVIHHRRAFPGLEMADLQNFYESVLFLQGTMGSAPGRYHIP